MPSPPPGPNDKCSVLDCTFTLKYLRRGYCDTHYRRVLHHGTTERTLAPALDHYDVDPLTQCWLFKGRLEKGYGRLTRKIHGTKTAHRASFIEHRPGVPIAGLELDHLCRTPACINPDHLEPVTSKINQERGIDVRRQGMCKNMRHRMTPENTSTSRGVRDCLACIQARRPTKKKTS